MSRFLDVEEVTGSIPVASQVQETPSDQGSCTRFSSALRFDDMGVLSMIGNTG